MRPRPAGMLAARGAGFRLPAHIAARMPSRLLCPRTESLITAILPLLLQDGLI